MQYPPRLARPGLRVAAIACSLVLASCGRDMPVGLRTPGESSRQDRGANGPWAMMTNAQLASAVAAADGEVFIGLKTPGVARGVGLRGERLLDRAREAEFKRQLRGFGITFRREYQLIPAVHAVLPAHLVAAVRGLPFVDYVEPIVLGVRLGQDTTWNIRKVGAPEAWNRTKGGAVKVLIIDSGVMQGHEDLGADVIHACDGSNGHDTFGHGTFVSGIVRATDNAMGIVGGGPQLLLYSGKDGDAQPNPAYTACEIEWGRQQGVFVINISTGWQQPFTALADQINAAYAEGRLIIAAAGNTYGGAVLFPASLPNVIAVGASTMGDLRASFSPVDPKVELVAPGAAVESTTLPGDLGGCGYGALYGTCSGTSFASPHVAFAAALVKAANPTWSGAQVRTRLQETARDLGSPGRDNEYGYGRLDVAAAVSVQPPGPGFSVTIDGPMCLYSTGSYEYSAQSSGGTSPITYTWYRDVAPYDEKWEWLGTGQSIQPYFDAGSYGAQLKVRATPYMGSPTGVIMYVYMNSIELASPLANVPADSSAGERQANLCAGGGGGPPPDP